MARAGGRWGGARRVSSGGMASRNRHRRVAAVLLALAAAPVVYLAALNGFANLVLPSVLSRSPAHATVGWGFVWMWVPGRVAVLDDLSVRVAGPRGTLTLTAARASGTVDLRALLRRELRISALDAEGVSVAFDPGASGPPPRGEPLRVRVDGAARVEAVAVDGLAYQGALDVEGRLALADTLEVEGRAEVRGGAVAADGVVVASALRGPVSVALAGWPRGARVGREGWSHVSGEARLRGEIEGLSFLAPYLERAPWLSLVGTGTLAADLRVERGALAPGSTVDAETRDLTMRFLSYDIVGDGVVHAEVGDVLGMPVSRVDVAFGAFTIGEAGAPPLVEGAGFTVLGESPDVSLAAPFSTVELSLDLPRSRIPTLPAFNVFLPTDVGVALTGGRGSVEGRLAASTRDGVASGRATFAGDDVTARFDAADLAFDFTLDAPLREARLTEHVYDFSGARLALRDLGIAEAAPAKGTRWSSERTWWATFEVPRGQALVGRPEYLDAEVTLAAADASAVVRLVSQRKELPGWLQKALALPDVRGGGRLRLGLGSLALEPMSLAAGRHFEVGMRWHRRSDGSDGALFAAWRDLSVGFRFDAESRELVPFGARDWFAGAAAATAEDPPGDVAVPAPPAERWPVIRWRKKPRAP